LAVIDWDTLLNAPVQDVFADRQPVIYARPDEPPIEVRGIFEHKHVPVDFGDGAAMSAMEVALYVRLSEFPPLVSPAQGDRLQIRGATWFVQDVQHRGEGEAKLVLSGRSPIDG
jgi:hypothetical protein